MDRFVDLLSVSCTVFSTRHINRGSILGILVIVVLNLLIVQLESIDQEWGISDHTSAICSIMHHKSFLYPWFLKSDVKVICSSNFVTGDIELELHVGFWFRTLKIFLFWGLPIQVDVLIPSLCDVLHLLLVFLLLSAVCNVVLILTFALQNFPSLFLC